tara:strand:+ start:674 stop:898 length:225 start_codon:yes stop_codon:yes gene_type:complete
MKLLVFVVFGLALWISVPHLQSLLLRVFVDRGVERLMDDMKESVPSVDLELPLESPEQVEENNVVGEVSLPSVN